ncbi:MAG: hypothetical protein HY290_07650 [Planctomycetia bacterium]|nr:hypothetical protein [Planctomycetia bacterium]
MKQALLVIVGAAVGGFLGYKVFFWFYHQGLYGLVIPGGLLGIGAGLARNRSRPLAVACGIAALLLGLFTEWRTGPFFKIDNSLSYFLLHIHKLSRVTLLMVPLGGLVGYWAAYRGSESKPTSEPPRDK